MTSFSPSFLEEIRNRLPVSEVVGKSVRLQRAGREYRGLCPFHNEKGPSFYVNDDKQFYHCFGCGAHGDVITFAMNHGGLSFPEAVENLAGLAGLPLPRPDPKEREIYDQQKIWRETLEHATRFFERQLLLPTGRPGLDYFRSRGLSDEAISRFRLGFAPPDAQALIGALKQAGCAERDMLELGLIRKSENSAGHYSFFRNRVIFPVGDRRGNPVAFGARLLTGDGPKYINSPDHPLFHKGKLLYGLSRARGAVQQQSPLIVVEGYMDVIALAEAGYSGAVAPLGTAMTEEQMLALWKLLPRLEDRNPTWDYSPILCFDGDAAGQRAASRALERALPLLTPAHTLRFAFMPPGEDPDSLLRRSGKLAMQAILDQAQPLIDFIWQQTIQGRRLQTPEDQSALRAIFAQQVAKITDPELKANYSQAIKDRLFNLLRPKPLFNRQNTAGRSGFPPRTGSPTVPAPQLVRRTPGRPGLLQEQIVLATLINHPNLLAEFQDDLQSYPFTTAAHRDIADHMVHIFAQLSHEVLDAEQFFGHLSRSLAEHSATSSLEQELTALLSERIYRHAGFARPQQRSELARNALLEIRSKRDARQTDPDIAAAKQRFNEDPSADNQRQLQAIIRATQKMQQEGDALALIEGQGDIV